MPYQLTGFSKTNGGTVFSFCHCYLMKHSTDSPETLTQIATTTSDFDGRYIFSGIVDNNPKYSVIFYRPGDDDAFDVTDFNLTPVAILAPVFMGVHVDDDPNQDGVVTSTTQPRFIVDFFTEPLVNDVLRFKNSGVTMYSVTLTQNMIDTGNFGLPPTFNNGTYQVTVTHGRGADESAASNNRTIVINVAVTGTGTLTAQAATVAGEGTAGVVAAAPNFIYLPGIPDVFDQPLHGVTLYGDNDNSDVELWQDYLFNMNAA